LAWERIEHHLRKHELFFPHEPFAENLDTQTCLFIDTRNTNPAAVGSRLILTTIWLCQHYLLVNAPGALDNGICQIFLACGISYSNFYPEIQKAITESVQNALPIRLKKFLVVDPPLIFNVLFKIVSLWLSAKLTNRLNLISSDDITDHVDPVHIPTHLGIGGKYSTDDKLDAWLLELKTFFHDSFVPAMQAVMVDQDELEIKAPDLFEPREEAVEKQEKKERKEQAKLEKKEQKEKD